MQWREIKFLVLWVSTLAGFSPAEITRQAIQPAGVQRTDQDATSFNPPQGYLRSTAVYDDYFGMDDSQLIREYRQQFGYHESQVNYVATSYRYEYFASGTTYHLGHAPYIGQIREELARKIFNARLDKGIRKYFETNTPSLRKVESTRRAMEKAKNVTLFQPTAPANPNERVYPQGINLGYDILFDTAKIEIQFLGAMLGFHHPNFASRLSQGREIWETSYAHITYAPAPEFLPTTSITHATGSPYLAAHISQPITRTISTSFTTTQDVGRHLEKPVYEVRLSWGIEL